MALKHSTYTYTPTHNHTHTKKSTANPFKTAPKTILSISKNTEQQMSITTTHDLQ